METSIKYGGPKGEEGDQDKSVYLLFLWRHATVWKRASGRGCLKITKFKFTYFMDGLFLKFYIWACRYALHWNLIFAICLIQYFTQNLIYLYKFYPVRSFHYSWNNNLVLFLYKRNNMIYTWKLNFVLLLSHFIVNKYNKYWQSCFNAVF